MKLRGFQDENRNMKMIVKLLFNFERTQPRLQGQKEVKFGVK